MSLARDSVFVMFFAYGISYYQLEWKLEFWQEYQDTHPACEGITMENEQNERFLVDMLIFHKVDMFIFQKAKDPWVREIMETIRGLKPARDPPMLTQNRNHKGLCCFETSMILLFKSPAKRW